MHQMFSEDVQVFDIKVSRREYKKKHPYKDVHDGFDDISPVQDCCVQALTSDREEYIEKTLSAVDDQRLKESLKKAMTADLKRQKEKK